AYPLGKKWRHLYQAKGTTKYIVCIADEGEPGTFKDIVLLSEDPLSVIEGMIIAGFLFSAKAGYIYMRGVYRRIQKTFQEALDNAG
ncbi:NADH-quinone oxidoreductase subunit F, partial [Enterococcus faecalis]